MSVLLASPDYVMSIRPRTAAGTLPSECRFQRRGGQMQGSMGAVMSHSRSTSFLPVGKILRQLDRHGHLAAAE